jgi:predicted KAP-like P-loop ATPase
LSEEGYLYSCYHGKQLIEKIFPESARQILLNKNLEEARSFCSVEQICEEVKLFEPDQHQHLLCALEERIGEVQEKEKELSKAKEKISQNEDNVEILKNDNQVLKKDNQTLLELIERYKQTLQSYKEAASSSGRY